jgi:hypothetical protein
LGATGQLSARKQALLAFETACGARGQKSPDAFAADMVAIVQQRRQELVTDAHLNRSDKGFPQIVESPDLFPKTSAEVRPGAQHVQLDCTLGPNAPAVDDLP